METRTTIWYGRNRFQTFAVLTSCSCRRPDVLFLSSSSSSWRHAAADILTSCSCRRLDVTLLPTSCRLVPADVLTSYSYRRPDVLFLSSSSSSWRHASSSWRRVPVVVSDELKTHTRLTSSRRQLVIVAFALCFPRLWRSRRSSGASVPTHGIDSANDKLGLCGNE